VSSKLLLQVAHLQIQNIVLKSQSSIDKKLAQDSTLYEKVCLSPFDTVANMHKNIMTMKIFVYETQKYLKSFFITSISQCNVYHLKC